MKRIVSMVLAVLMLLPVFVLAVPANEVYAVEYEKPATYQSETKTANEDNAYVWPIGVNKLTQLYHSSHKGLDISASYGTPIYAALDGKVICASTSSTSASHTCSTCGYQGAGYHVVVLQIDGYRAMYAHMSTVSVKTGATVSAGDKLGGVGSTGNSTGNHLHFALIPKTNGSYYAKDGIDPLTKITPYCSVYADNITATDATLYAHWGANSMPVSTAGIYVGTSVQNMQKISENLGLSWGHSNTHLFYNLNKWYGKLTNGTRYYYQFWQVSNGVEYKSAIYTFVSGGASKQVEKASIPQAERYNSVTVLSKTSTDARIEAKIPLTYTSEVGFYFGTTESNMVKHVETISAQNVGWIAYNISESGVEIKPDTTYYYQFYYMYNGTMYKSDVRTLKTAACTHTYDGGVVTKAATSTQEGTKLFTCTVCGATKTETIAKLSTTVVSPFTDVPATEWYTQTILAVYEKGLMIGDSLTTFNPDGKMTVAQALTIAARIHSLNTTGKEVNILGGDKWYDGYVNYAIVNGIILYNDFDNYDRNATRAEMAYVFSNCVGTDKLSVINPNSSAPDVASDQKYAAEITALYRAGVVQGSDEIGRYYPERDITRAEVATIVARLTNIVDRIH